MIALVMDIKVCEPMRSDAIRCRFAQRLARSLSGGKCGGGQEEDGHDPQTAADGEPVGAAHDHGRMLASLIDDHRFPAQSAALAEGIFEGGDEEWDVNVEFGLDGIGVLVASRVQ